MPAFLWLGPTRLLFGLHGRISDARRSFSTQICDEIHNRLDDSVIVRGASLGEDSQGGAQEEFDSHFLLLDTILRQPSYPGLRMYYGVSLYPQPKKRSGS